MFALLSREDPEGVGASPPAPESIDRLSFGTEQFAVILEREKALRETSMVCKRCKRKPVFADGCAHQGDWHTQFGDCSPKCAWGLGVGNLGKCHWSCCFSTEESSVCPLAKHEIEWTARQLSTLEQEVRTLMETEQALCSSDVVPPPGSPPPGGGGEPRGVAQSTVMTGGGWLNGARGWVGNITGKTSTTNHRKGREMLAPSVHTLLGDFAELCGQMGCPLHEDRKQSDEYPDPRRPNVYDILQRVLLDATANTTCSRDGRLGAALVDVLEVRGGGGSVGPATVMLSYTWAYELFDIVHALEGYCKQSNANPRMTFVWVCFGCINQHRVQEQGVVSPEEFRDAFEGRVRQTKHILSLIAPWSDPANLKRCW